MPRLRSLSHLKVPALVVGALAVLAAPTPAEAWRLWAKKKTVATEATEATSASVAVGLAGLSGWGGSSRDRQAKSQAIDSRLSGAGSRESHSPGA